MLHTLANRRRGKSVRNALRPLFELKYHVNSNSMTYNINFPILERTKNMLFQGAKNVSLGLSPTKDQNLNEAEPKRVASSGVLPGQLRIDQGGYLCARLENGHQNGTDMDTAEVYYHFSAQN